jgi:hypothetical protein
MTYYPKPRNILAIVLIWALIMLAVIAIGGTLWAFIDKAGW